MNMRQRWSSVHETGGWLRRALVSGLSSGAVYRVPMSDETPVLTGQDEAALCLAVKGNWLVFSWLPPSEKRYLQRVGYVEAEGDGWKLTEAGRTISLSLEAKASE